MAGLTYSGIAACTGAPFFKAGEQRLDLLWEIYMTPMFDQEPVLPQGGQAHSGACPSFGIKPTALRRRVNQS